MAVIFTRENNYLSTISDMADMFQIPMALILAHGKAESDFDPNAVRMEPAINDQSTGIMQLLLSTAKSLDSNATIASLYDPSYNIYLGSMLISKNLSKANGNIQDEAAMYNSGVALKNAQGKYVSRSGNDVQTYVDRIVKYYNMYQDWLSRGSPEVDIESIDPSDILMIGGITFAVVMMIIYGRHK